MAENAENGDEWNGSDWIYCVRCLRRVFPNPSLLREGLTILHECQIRNNGKTEDQSTDVGVAGEVA